MFTDRESATKIAQLYFKTSAPLTSLGWGISGYVYLSPDLRTAVKVHRAKEGFETELRIYLRLRRLKIAHIAGLAIPRLRDYQDRGMLIRMDVVQAPYLLDFAGVSFTPPDFPEDTMND